MDFERAQEIFNSPETIEVLYRGEPIWIEKLDPTTESAQVSSYDAPEQTLTVPVRELQEGETV